MKKTHSIQKKINLLLGSLLLTGILWSQSVPEVTVNGHDASSWFAQNWLWIAGVIVLLVLIILFMGGSARSRRTTVTTDRNGHVQRTTSTEIVE